MRKVEIIENRSELGAGTRGSSLGIEALKIAAAKKENDFFLTHNYTSIFTENNLLNYPVKHPEAKRIEGIAKIYDRICTMVKGSIEDGNFPLVISGDHSSAGGTIAGVKSAFPDKRLGVIWIDAHADLHTPFTSPSGNVHGMPLATATGEDNTEMKSTDPSSEVLKLWNEMKDLGGISPKINYSDLVFIALRDFEEAEHSLIERNNVKVFKTGEVNSQGAKSIAEQSLYYLKDCDILYVSFDVDSMDSSISMGTGTPVPGGLMPEQAIELLQSFASDPRLKCLEFTEVNPLLDKKNVMAETTFEILEAVDSKL